MTNLHHLLRQAVLTVIGAWPLLSTAQLPNTPRKLEFLSEPTRFATQESLVELQSDKPCVMAIGIVVDPEGHVIEASVDDPVCSCTDERTIEQALAIARGYAFGPSTDAPNRHWARITWEFKAPPAPAVLEQEGDRLPTPVADPTIDVAYAQVRPEFPGGEPGIQAYLRSALRYPEDLREAGIQGTVFLELVIWDDGSVRMVQLKRGVHPSLDREAMRVIKAMPAWTPGSNIRGPVPVRITLPVKFKVEAPIALPDWMSRIVGRVVPHKTSPNKGGSTGARNGFVGSYEATFQLKGDADMQDYRLSAWSDSTRTVLQFTGEGSSIAYLADIEADVALLARADSVGGHAAIHLLSDVVRMNQLYWFKASWDSCRVVPRTPALQLLGAVRPACYHTEGQDTTRYWRSSIEPSPFMDARLHVPVPTLEPFEVFMYVCKLDGAMPLRVEAPRLVFEVTDVRFGKQPLPTLDLSGHALFDVREGNSAVKRVGTDGNSEGVTTKKPAVQQLAWGAPWFNVSIRNPTRTLLNEPEFPSDAPPGCMLCVDLMIDDLGMVISATVDRTNATEPCLPFYERSEMLARSLRFTPRRVALKPGQKGTACFRSRSR